MNLHRHKVHTSKMKWWGVNLKLITTLEKQKLMFIVYYQKIRDYCILLNVTAYKNRLSGCVCFDNI